jgi:UrcA family protein
MSRSSPSPRWSRFRATAVPSACAVAWLMMPALAMADPAAAPSQSESRITRISLADLDLTTEQGTRTARQRVTAAAQRLCWQLGDSTRTSNRSTVSACVRDTIAEAMKAIEQPQVAALNGGH